MFKNFLVNKKDKRMSLIKSANDFVEEVRKKKAVSVISSSLMLENDEKAFLEEKTTFAEPRAVRKNTGSGMGFRLMKGVYLGGYSGKSESNQEWKAIDQGTVTITNKRIIFRGSKENKTITISKVISVNSTLDSIELTIEDKNKLVSFAVENPYIWATVVRICKGANPLQLGNTELDFQFK